MGVRGPQAGPTGHLLRKSLSRGEPAAGGVRGGAGAQCPYLYNRGQSPLKTCWGTEINSVEGHHRQRRPSLLPTDFFLRMCIIIEKKGKSVN